MEAIEQLIKPTNESKTDGLTDGLTNYELERIYRDFVPYNLSLDAADAGAREFENFIPDEVDTGIPKSDEDDYYGYESTAAINNLTHSPMTTSQINVGEESYKQMPQFVNPFVPAHGISRTRIGRSKTTTYNFKA